MLFENWQAGENLWLQAGVEYPDFCVNAEAWTADLTDGFESALSCWAISQVPKMTSIGKEERRDDKAREEWEVNEVQKKYVFGLMAVNG